MSEGSVRVVARVIALPDKVEDLKTVLQELVDLTRQEGGCLQYDLLQNQAEPTDFTFVETWKNKAALDHHLASAHLQLAFQKVEGLIAAAPDIRLYTQIQ